MSAGAGAITGPISKPVATATTVTTALEATKVLPPDVCAVVGAYVNFCDEEIGHALSYVSVLFHTLGQPASAAALSFDTQLRMRTTLPSKKEVELYQAHALIFTDPLRKGPKHPWLARAMILERVFGAVIAQRAPIPSVEAFVDYLKTIIGLNCMYIKDANKIMLEISAGTPSIDGEVVNIAPILTICLTHYRNFTLCLLTDFFNVRPIPIRFSGYPFALPTVPYFPKDPERGSADFRTFMEKHRRAAIAPHPIPDVVNSLENPVESVLDVDKRMVIFELWPHDNCITLRNSDWRSNVLDRQHLVQAMLASGIALSQDDLNCALCYACCQSITYDDYRPRNKIYRWFDLTYIQNLVSKGANIKLRVLLFNALSVLIEKMIEQQHVDSSIWQMALSTLEEELPSAEPVFGPFYSGPIRADQYVASTAEWYGIEERGKKTKPEDPQVIARRKAEFDFMVRTNRAVFITPFDQLLQLGADPNGLYGNKDLIRAIASYPLSGKRTAIAREVIKSILSSAKTHPPSGNLLLSMHIYFNEIFVKQTLSPEHEKSLRNSVLTAQFKDRVERLVLNPITYYQDEKDLNGFYTCYHSTKEAEIHLSHAVTLAEKQGVNLKDELELALFKMCAMGIKNEEDLAEIKQGSFLVRDMSGFFADKKIQLTEFSDAMLDFYLTQIRDIVNADDAQLQLMDKLAALHWCITDSQSPYRHLKAVVTAFKSIEQFLEKLLQRAIANEKRFGTLIIFLSNALDEMKKQPARESE
jgi:hypothetical protein